MLARSALLTLLFCGALSPASARAQAADEIKVVRASGEEHKIKREGPGFGLRGPGVEHYALAPAADTWVLLDGKRMAALKALGDIDGELRIVDAGGAVKHRVRRDGEGVRVLLPDGKLAFRIKVKDDKFNVYDGDARRLCHGKAKDDAYTVKDEGQKDRAIKIKGARSLDEAAPFALPIEFGEAALLWRVLAR